MRRYLLASGFSLVYLVVLFLYHWEGLVATDTLVRASVLVTSLIAVFYAVFRSGLNLRMRDPSLTALQMMSAVFAMLYVLHEARATREIFGLFLFVAFMFGMLRLSTRALLLLAAVSMAGLALVIALHAYGGESGETVRRDLAHWIVLAVTMPWLIQIGGYVRRLRKDLADASVKLEDVEDQARHDDLTGVFNRRVLMAALQAEKNRCDRTGEDFCVCMIDIDYFKRINDEAGHLAGDAVLREFARAAQEELRSTDIFGRYGGEEFMQILPHTAIDGALKYADRVRVRALELDLSGLARRIPLTVSVGVAQYRHGESVGDVLSHADAALYSAKQSGRNRVVAATAMSRAH
jgi:diguanylate cyclase (GGDEF)-like protein